MKSLVVAAVHPKSEHALQVNNSCFCRTSFAVPADFTLLVTSI
jgi:hypothetical protein